MLTRLVNCNRINGSSYAPNSIWLQQKIHGLGPGGVVVVKVVVHVEVEVVVFVLVVVVVTVVVFESSKHCIHWCEVLWPP
mmetsp:Transcript_122892/g.352976  ORF Transcript_122892/g.352976 Transcript_122892/m.352976 type:complete len:80 (+) Transcript_122892:1780-2019(+)